MSMIFHTSYNHEFLNSTGFSKSPFTLKLSDIGNKITFIISHHLSTFQPSQDLVHWVYHGFHTKDATTTTDGEACNSTALNKIIAIIIVQNETSLDSKVYFGNE